MPLSKLAAPDKKRKHQHEAAEHDMPQSANPIRLLGGDDCCRRRRPVPERVGELTRAYVEHLRNGEVAA